MKRWITLLTLSLLLTTVMAAHAQTDGDGDGVPDDYDSCAQDFGSMANSGCPDGMLPDFDRDGVPDAQDLCYQEAGDARLLGCTSASFPDSDQDGVGDPLDACPNEAGDPANSGCPAGVTPDLDHDGVADAQDTCLFEAGVAENNGCPSDQDGDGIPDYADACAAQAGVTANYGCPDGGQAADGDGDGVPDVFDQCAMQAGSSAVGGCPDADADNVTDALDACADIPGDPTLLGCPQTESAALGAGRPPITAANAVQLTELSKLVLSTPSFALASNGTLAVRGSQKLLVYNVDAGQLAPSASADISAGASIDVSGDGQFIATIEVPSDLSALYVAIRSGQTGQPVAEIRAGSDGLSAPTGINEIAFSPVTPVLAAVESASIGISSDQPATVALYSIPSGQKIAALAHPGGIAHIAWSANGTRLAVDTVEAGQMVVYVWDVPSQTHIATLPTTATVNFVGTPMAFSPDGMRLAVGKPDGTLSLYDLTTGTTLGTIQVFDGSRGEVISAVAFSPNGQVIAATGGVPTASGPAGTDLFPVALIDISGRTVGLIVTKESLIGDLKFSADGSLLITSAAVSLRFYGIAN